MLVLVVHLGIPRAEALLLPKLLLIPKPLSFLQIGYPVGLPGSFAESRQKILYVKFDKVPTKVS